MVVILLKWAQIPASDRCPKSSPKEKGDGAVRVRTRGAPGDMTWWPLEHTGYQHTDPSGIGGPNEHIQPTCIIPCMIGAYCWFMPYAHISWSVLFAKCEGACAMAFRGRLGLRGKLRVSD